MTNNIFTLTTYLITARSDMLTVLASAWNKRKSENLAKSLSQRYVKVFY